MPAARPWVWMRCGNSNLLQRNAQPYLGLLSTVQQQR
jgi:hypothetical protein